MPDFARSLFSFGFAGRQERHQQELQRQQEAEQQQRQPLQQPAAAPQPQHQYQLQQEAGFDQARRDKESPTPYVPPKGTPISAVSSASALGGLYRQDNKHNITNKDISGTQSHEAKQSSLDTNTNKNSDGEQQQGLVPPAIIETTNVLGRLKVRIIEARNLTTPDLASPYVVCTFDSSEFIGHGATGSTSNSSSAGGTITSTSGGIAIPKSRQSSSLALAKLGAMAARHGAANPLWKDEAQFDVTCGEPELDISIYDALHGDAFLGHARVKPDFKNQLMLDTWLPLQARVAGEHVTGELRVSVVYQPFSRKRAIGPDDFEVLRLVGKGTFGKVYQVRKRDTQRIYAMKVLSKKAIVQKKEVAHTIGERDILVRTSSVGSGFIVNLKFSFQTPTDLYLVTDYMSGGELFWHLQKEGKFSEERAKFYIAELIVALEQLHNNGIVYRDLKPENILLDANGHVALCDFGLSKANLRDDGTTSTFCGTTEYLAPEVLLDDQGYTKMVDFWSLGVLVFEMCCGWSPFYAEDNQQMYKNIAFGKVRFPRDALSAEGRSFVKGLLNRNPKHRLGAIGDARELMAHPFFTDIDWEALKAKKVPPPFKPQVASETDTSNFDPEFTQASTSAVHRAFLNSGSTPLSPGIQANFQGFTYVDSSLEDQFKSHNQRLGASYCRHAALDEDIEWYDEKDDSERGNKQGNRMDDEDENGKDEDEDVHMRDHDDDEHDFVNGQGFEM